MLMRAAVIVFAALLLPSDAFANTRAGEKKAQLCLLCHKVANTRAPLSPMPLLEGQPAPYLYRQTKAFKDGRRTDAAMQTNVANLSDRDMRDIADYLSAQKPVRGVYQIDPAKVAVGKARAQELGCASCHQPTFAGTDQIPRLAGQTPGYLLMQLEAFGAGKRAHGAGDRRAPAIALGEQEIEALAQFLASVD